MVSDLKIKQLFFRSLQRVVLALCLIVTYCQAAEGQLPASSDDTDPADSERIFVHLNKSIYVAGEYIHYRAYTVKNNITGSHPASKILYFVLSGYDHDKSIEWRINLNESIVTGSYKLPGDMTPGSYVLTAYTNHLRGKSRACLFSCSLLVMNLTEAVPDTLYLPYRESEYDQESTPMSTEPDDQVTDPALGIIIGNVKPVYAQGEKISLEIALHDNLRDDTAKVSLSVSEKIPFSGMYSHNDITAAFNKVMDTYQTDCKFGFEDKGYILTGRILQGNNGLPVAGGNVLLGVSDTISTMLLYAATDSTGSFCFYLNPAYDNREIILQLLGTGDRAEIIWEIEDKKVLPEIVWSPSILQPEQKEYLNHTNNIRLIDAIFSGRPEKKLDTLSAGSVNYFSKPEWIIYPSEYADLINFTEIDNNILPVVKFNSRKDRYELMILNTPSGKWSDNCALFLNGILFTDLNYIAALGTRDIKRIEVIPSGFIIGDLTFDGILSIYTVDGQIPAGYISNHCLSFQNTVNVTRNPETSYVELYQSKQGSHLPDFRNSLCWEPELNLTGDDKQIVEFQASQLSGTYLIRIQGITSSGKPLTAITTFEIKQRTR